MVPGSRIFRVSFMKFQNSSISATLSIASRTTSASLANPSAFFARRSVRSSTKKALRFNVAFRAIGIH